ncbi:MAG: S-methyl-5'-thioadenosine phosphorylase [Phycisphaerae bacterium]
METPRIGIIGGSGLGQRLLAEVKGQSVEVDTPFGKPSAPIMLADWGGIPIAFLARHGVGHLYNPSTVPYRANIYALKALNCRWIVASGAVGSLREEIRPKDLVIADQVIDKTYRRDNTFFDHAAVHVEFADPFCPELRKILIENSPGAEAEFRIRGGGTYVCMEGPAFSTRAESLMHRSWGGDLIGMTAMPEAKLAREAEISYALVALATDYDCWKTHAMNPSKQALIEEISGNLSKATNHVQQLLTQALPAVWESRQQDFPSHHAMELGIWSNKSAINPTEIKRLELLWGKYF